MTEEINNEIWMLRSARLDQQATVQKLLREGFEPFWGVQVSVNKDVGNGVIEKEKVVRMYFRKPPTLTVDSASLDWFDPTEQLNTVLTESGNVFRSAFSGMLDSFMDRFFERLGEYEKVILDIPVAETKLFTPLGDKKADEVDEPAYDDGQPKGNSELTGDGFRVVDNIPEEATVTTQRTNAQDSTIEDLKGKGNVTILPGLTDNGSVRAMIGAELYTIERDGNFTVENTGAGTNSQIVGG